VKHQDDATIVAMDVWACSVPLSATLSFGSYSITSREYVAVRVTTRGGLVSDCLALSRRAPIDVAIADVIAPLLMGTNALDIVARVQSVRIATSAMDADGIMGRGLSLIEICLWDLLAQSAGMPLWRLLGGTPQTAPVLLVEGYTLPNEGDQEFAERLAARAKEGFRAIKIEAGSYASPAHLGRRLALLRQLAGDGLRVVIDLAWSCRNAREAVAAARSWVEFGIEWLEDPIPRSLPHEIARFRSSISVPVGAGDEATRPAELIELLAQDAVDVLRVDATAIGGIMVAKELAARATADGRNVSAHVSPEIHQHLAFASPVAQYIEAFPLDRPFDAAHELLVHSFMDEVRGGQAVPPKGPGIGIQLDLDSVQRYAYRRSHVEHPAKLIQLSERN
jgi:L-alanine-DL-glutamate epimerase-like enolase superfamily enzyme